MSGAELLNLLQALSPDDLKREIILSPMYSPTACQKVLKVRMGGIDSMRSYEGIDALVLGDYCAPHSKLCGEVLIHKGRHGRTFKTETA